MTRETILTAAANYASPTALEKMSTLALYELIDIALDFQSFVCAGLSPQDAIWLAI